MLGTDTVESEDRIQVQKNIVGNMTECPSVLVRLVHDAKSSRAIFSGLGKVAAFHTHVCCIPVFIR